MPCRQHFGLGAVDLVQTLAPGKMQTPCKLGYTWRRIFRESAVHGEADFVSTTPQLNAPIISKRSDIEAGDRRVGQQPRHRHPNLVTHSEGAPICGRWAQWVPDTQPRNAERDIRVISANASRLPDVAASMQVERLILRRSLSGEFFKFGAAASKSPIDCAIQTSRSKSDSLMEFSSDPPAPPNPPRSGWLDELGRLKGGRPKV